MECPHLAFPAAGHVYLTYPPENYYALDKIRAWEAWKITKGSGNVRIGIIDSGIFPHRDLAAVRKPGWNFVNDTPDSGGDKTGHGTNIAGIIGAAHYYGTVYGICENSGLIPLEVVDSGEFNRRAVISAVKYASENAVPILVYCHSFRGYDRELESAIKEYPGLFVCSAGNLGRDIDVEPLYPPSYKLENMICVAASDEYDLLSGYSNYGRETVHLAAPGDKIFTTSIHKYPYRQYGASYEFVRGTSAAVPFVAGAAALIKSLIPGADTAFIKSAILQNADKSAGFSGRLITGGRLNIYKSVLTALKNTTANALTMKGWSL